MKMVFKFETFLIMGCAAAVLGGAFEAAMAESAPTPPATSAGSAAPAHTVHDRAEKKNDQTAESDREASEEEASEAELNEQKTASDAISRDLSANLKPIYEIGHEDGSGPKIGVNAWVNRKDLTYSVGDTLSISVKTRKDAYVTILNVGSSGTTTVLYPNHFQRDAKVRAGTVVRIPAKKQKWQITVGGPTGVDLIKVIASKKPLTLKELQSVASTDEKNPVISLGRSGDEAARDLSAQLKPNSDDANEPAFGVQNILIRVKR